MLPSIQGIPSTQIIQLILNTLVVPTALVNWQHPTHPQQLESLLRPPVSFTAKAHRQYPLPVIHFRPSIQDTPTIPLTLNTRIALTHLLNRARAMHNLEDPQHQP